MGYAVGYVVGGVGIRVSIENQRRIGHLRQFKGWLFLYKCP